MPERVHLHQQCLTCDKNWPAQILLTSVFVRYLSQSGCTSIDGVDDAAEFRVVCKAMTDIGIKTEDQEAVFALLAGGLRGAGAKDRGSVVTKGPGLAVVSSQRVIRRCVHSCCTLGCCTLGCCTLGRCALGCPEGEGWA